MTKKEFKLACLDYKGTRACISCGYDADIRLLQFHHREPKTKNFSICHYPKLELDDEVRAELDLCDVLCRKCHFDLHKIPYDGTKIYDLRYHPRKGRKKKQKVRGPEKFLYTFKTISEITGIRLTTLYTKASRGEFDPKNLVSLSKFICRNTVLQEKWD